MPNKYEIFNGKTYSIKQIVSQTLKIESKVKSSNWGVKIFDFLQIISPTLKDVTINLSVGTNSFTDFKNIWLSLPKYALFLPEPVIFKIFKEALLAHEAEHILSTGIDGEDSQEVLKNFYEEVFDGIFKPLDVSKGFSTTIAKYVVNSIEDGRIERIAVNRTPSILKTMKYFRYLHWYNMPIKNVEDYEDEVTNTDKMYDLLWGVCTIATFGEKPTNWDENYAGSVEDDMLDEIYFEILESINSNDFETVLDVSYFVLDKFKEYLTNVYKTDGYEEAEDLQKIKDKLSQISSSNFSAGNGVGNPTNGSAGNSAIGTKNSVHNSSKSKSSSLSNLDSSNSGNLSESSNKSNPLSAGTNPNKSKGPSQNDEDEIEIQSDGSIVKSVSSKTGGALKDLGQVEVTNEELEELKASMDKLAEEIAAQGEKETSTPAQPELPQTRKTAQRSQPTTLKDLNELGELDANKTQFRVVPSSLNKFEGQIFSEPRINLAGAEMNKRLKKVLVKKEVKYSKGTRRGMLDTSKLSSYVAYNNPNIFKRKNSIETCGGSIYLLIDRSGSMDSGSKWRNALDAAAIIERSLFDLIELKISAFNTAGNFDTVITEFKDFSDTGLGFVENIRRKLGPDGGNRDGYAIRIAGHDLLQRPAENKFLIVLSDGMPSDYAQGYEDGFDDVYHAVRTLRKKGLNIFGVYFGDDNKESIEAYKYMYGDKTSVFCKPEELTDIVPSLIERLLK